MVDDVDDTAGAEVLPATYFAAPVEVPLIDRVREYLHRRCFPDHSDVDLIEGEGGVPVIRYNDDADVRIGAMEDVVRWYEQRVVGPHRARG